MEKPDGATATFSSAGGDEAAKWLKCGSWATMGEEGKIYLIYLTPFDGFDLDMHKMTRSDNFDFHEDDDDDD